jgi:hypothetical protein
MSALLVTTGKPTTNRINIDFYPNLSITAKNCDKIAFVQFIRLMVDGSPMSWADLEGPKSEYLDVITYNARDKDANDRWCVDIGADQRTPYTQESQAIKWYGSKNGSLVEPAKMFDQPYTKAEGPKAKGFFDPTSNPKGCRRVRYNFATYAFCAAGSECGHFYEGVRWDWSLKAEDFHKGMKGESVFNSFDPWWEYPYILAFKLFQTRYGFKPCSGP